MTENTPNDEFPVEIMGEARYKHILEGICGAETPAGGLVKPARCIPDDNGVRVEIEGATVGYLMRSESWVYWLMMNGVTTECRALVRGRLRSGHGPPDEFSVRLDLVLPAIDPEMVGHGEEGDYGCQVVGESKHQAVLREIIRTRAATKPVAWVPRVTARLAREDTQPPAVRVEIGEQVVGYLSRGKARQYCAMANAPSKVPALIRCSAARWDRTEGDYSVGLALRVDPPPTPRDRTHS